MSRPSEIFDPYDLADSLANMLWHPSHFNLIPPLKLGRNCVATSPALQNMPYSPASANFVQLLTHQPYDRVTES
jgi:hypothetical protein